MDARQFERELNFAINKLQERRIVRLSSDLGRRNSGIAGPTPSKRGSFLIT
jgi:hypothetical protein